jgi:hypothetical protein
MCASALGEGIRRASEETRLISKEIFVGSVAVSSVVSSNFFPLRRFGGKARYRRLRGVGDQCSSYNPYIIFEECDGMQWELKGEEWRDERLDGPITESGVSVGPERRCIPCPINVPLNTGRKL